jgi:phage terminase small subunit
MAKRVKDTMEPQQKRFADEYLIDLNATAAALRAGYSPNTAAVIGYQVLHKPLVAAYVAQRQAELSRRTGISQERVINELARIALSDMKNFAEWGPDGVTLKDSEGLDPADSVCVAEVSQSTSKDGGSIKFKLHDKRAALVDLAKHLGLLPNDVNIKLANTSDADLIERAKSVLAGIGSPGTAAKTITQP